MSNRCNALLSLLHRRGVAGPARVRAFRGSGASKTSRRLILPVLVTVVGGLVFASAPALATTISPTATIKPVGTVTSTTAEVSGTVNPNGSPTTTVWNFQYAKDPETEGWTASAVSGIAVASEAVTGTIEGLEPNAAYQVRLVATNEEGGEGISAEPNPKFTTLTAPPTVAEESFSQVTSIGAQVTAQVNTENDGSSYYYEYGTAGEFQAGTPKRTPVQSLLASASPAAAPGLLTGLEPGTEYHFRLIATNGAGEVGEGGEVTFSSLPEGIQGLPDNRVYEMVSPPENQDAQVYVPLTFSRAAYFYLENPEYGIETKRPFQASADGDAVAYVADPTAPGEGERGDSKGDEYLATRAPGGGWTQVNLQPPGIKDAFYQAFSSDLSIGILTSETPLSSDAPGNEDAVLYARSNSEGIYSPF